jgi:hypothetical protein
MFNTMAHPNQSGPDADAPYAWPIYTYALGLPRTFWPGEAEEWTDAAVFTDGFTVYIPEASCPSIEVDGHVYTLCVFKGAGVWFSSGTFSEGSSTVSGVRWVLDDWDDYTTWFPGILYGACKFSWDSASSVLTIRLLADYYDPDSVFVEFVFPAFVVTSDQWSSRLETPTTAGGLVAFRKMGQGGPTPAHMAAPAPLAVFAYFPKPFALFPTSYRLTTPADYGQLSVSDWAEKSYFTFDGQQIIGWLLQTTKTLTVGDTRWGISNCAYNAATQTLSVVGTKAFRVDGVWGAPVYSCGYTFGPFDPQTDLTVSEEGRVEGSVSYVPNPAEPSPLALSWTGDSSPGPLVEMRVLPPKWATGSLVYQDPDTDLYDYSRPFCRPVELNVSVTGLVWKDGYDAAMNATFRLRWPDSINQIEVGNVLVLNSSVDFFGSFEYYLQAYVDVTSFFSFVITRRPVGGGAPPRDVFKRSVANGDFLAHPGDSVTLTNEHVDFSGSNIAHSGTVTLSVPA